MASTHIKRGWWYLYRCIRGPENPHGFFGRYPVFAANKDVVECLMALEQAHLGAGYVPTPGGWVGSMRYCPSGIGGHECEPSGKNCSLHNHGPIAWDIEYNYNKLSPYYPRYHSPEDIFVRDARLHKYTPEIVEAIKGVKNMDGERLFKWLGIIGDYMHWEIDVPPERANVDWTTVPDGVPPVEKPDQEVVYMLPVLRKGDGLDSRTFGDRTYLTEEVAALQAALRSRGYLEDGGTSHDPVCGIDGRFWDGTEAVVKRFQSDEGLVVDGIAGEATYTALFT